MGEVAAEKNGMRRFLIATGVTRDLPRSRDQLIGSVGRIVALFTETFGYQRVTSLGLDPTAEEFRGQLRDFCETCGSEDVVVLYHTGHAEVGASGHRLRTGGEGNLYVTSLLTSELAELMLEGTRLRSVLIILDTCFAGQGGAEALLAGMRTVNQAAGKTLVVVTAAHPREQVRAGDFAELFEQAVRHPATGGHEPVFLPLAAIIGHIRENPQRPRWQTVSESVLFNTLEELPFLPNPRFDVQLHGLDLLTQLRVEQQQLRTEDIRLHFLPRARGTDAPADTEWRFVGRHAALRDLTSWLRDERQPPIRIVTGDPGSGKSAVIGRLVALSDPRRRPSVPLEGVPADTVPDVRAVDIAVHARGLTTDQVLAALAVPVGITASSAGQFLTAVRNRRLVVVVDAIDEAVDPQDLAARLLRPLVDAAAHTGLRMLLGTRRHLLESIGASATSLDLDAEGYADPASVRRYVERCLRESRSDSVYLTARSEIVNAVATAVAEAAGRSFLVALIVSRTLAWQSHIPDPADQVWRASLPKTAADAMRQDLQTRLGTDMRKARDLMFPLAYAAGAGLPWEDMWAPLATILSGRSYVDDDIVWLRDNAGSYLVEALHKGRSVYRLYHAALTEYIRRDSDDQAVNRLIVEFLINHLRRACHSRELQWERAHPYTLAHLSTHAARARTLDSLMLDPEFLLAADPAGMLAALPAVQTPDAARAATAYQRALHHLQEASLGRRLAYLELSSDRSRATALSRRILAQSASQPWKVLWTRWKEETPHRVLRSDDDTPIISLRCISPSSRNPYVLAISAITWHIWDPITGQRLADGPNFSDIFTSADEVISEDENVLLVALTRKLRLSIYDLSRNKLRYTIPLSRFPNLRQLLHPSPSITCTSLSDGRAIAVILTYKGVRKQYPILAIWDLNTARLLSRFPLRHSGSNTLGLSSYRFPNGPTVAIVRGDSSSGASFAFDLYTRESLSITLPGRGEERNTGAVYLADRTGHQWLWEPSLSSSSFESRIRGVEPGPVRPELRVVGDNVDVIIPGLTDTKYSLVGHTAPVTGAGYVCMPDGEIVIVTGSLDGTIRVWGRGEVEQDSVADSASADATLFDTIQLDDGHIAGATLTSGGNCIQLWNFTDGVVVDELFLVHRAVALTCARWKSGNGAVMAYCTDSVIRGWDVITGDILFEFIGDPYSWATTMSVAVVPEGPSLLVTTGHNGSAVYLWSLRDGNLYRKLTDHTGWVTCAAYGINRGRATLVTIGRDSRIVVRTLPRAFHRRRFMIRRPWLRLWSESRSVEAMILRRITSSESVIIMRDLRGVVSVRRLRNGRLMGIIGVNGVSSNAVDSLTVGDGSLLVVTADDDTCIRVWVLNWRQNRLRRLLCRVSLVDRIEIETRILDMRVQSDGMVILNTSSGMAAIKLALDRVFSVAMSERNAVC